MFITEMKCIECDKFGKMTLGDIDVLADNTFNIPPGWYCRNCLIALIKIASIARIEE